MKRRDFLRAGLAATGAVALGGIPAPAEPGSGVAYAALGEGQLAVPENILWFNRWVLESLMVPEEMFRAESLSAFRTREIASP